MFLNGLEAPLKMSSFTGGSIIGVGSVNMVCILSSVEVMLYSTHCGNTSLKNECLPYGEKTNVASARCHQQVGQEQHGMDFL